MKQHAALRLSAGSADRVAQAAPDPLSALAPQRVMQACEGLSLSHIAEFTGYHPETARRYLRGKSKMPLVFAARVASALGLSTQWLLHGTGPMLASDPRARALCTLTLEEIFAELAQRLDKSRITPGARSPEAVAHAANTQRDKATLAELRNRARSG